jgi:hypothetical protein
MTIIELSFLENPRSNSVVIIIMVILILLVWRIGYGVMGLGTSQGDAGSSRLLSGAMLEACG